MCRSKSTKRSPEPPIKAARHSWGFQRRIYYYGIPQHHRWRKNRPIHAKSEKIVSRTHIRGQVTSHKAHVSDGGFTLLHLACAAWRESDIHQSTLRVRGHWDIADLPNLTLAWKMHQSNTETCWSKVLPSDAPQVWYGYRRTKNLRYMATQVYQRQWAGRSSTSWPKHGPGMQNTFIEHAWSTKIICRRHRCALSDFIFLSWITQKTLLLS